jgi:hypothetical protein
MITGMTQADALNNVIWIPCDNPPAGAPGYGRCGFIRSAA